MKKEEKMRKHKRERNEKRKFNKTHGIADNFMYGRHPVLSALRYLV